MYLVTAWVGLVLGPSSPGEAAIYRRQLLCAATPSPAGGRDARYREGCALYYEHVPTPSRNGPLLIPWRVTHTYSCSVGGGKGNTSIITCSMAPIIPDCCSLAGCDDLRCGRLCSQALPDPFLPKSGHGGWRTWMEVS